MDREQEMKDAFCHVPKKMVKCEFKTKGLSLWGICRSELLIRGNSIFDFDLRLANIQLPTLIRTVRRSQGLENRQAIYLDR